LPAFKNKNLRDPGPQAFGFLTSARAVLYTKYDQFSTHANKYAAFIEENTYAVFIEEYTPIINRTK